MTTTNDYIERNKVLELIDLLKRDDVIEHCVDYAAGWNEALEQIEGNVAEDILAADVHPERHGEWLLDDNASPYQLVKTYCSLCDYYNLITPYCPHCGAKMDGSSKSDNWIATSEQLPVENQIVETKIDDENGVRNEQELIYSHNLWFFPDMSMYVYYTPTHWRRSERTGGKDGESDEV